MNIKISHIDHVFMTVKDIEATCRFYLDILGIPSITYKETRKSLWLGDQKINLHPHGGEYTPHANVTSPGTLDLCFITENTINDVTAHLNAHNIPIEEGPVETHGARGKMCSVYFRDPDLNLIEVARYTHINK